MEGGRVSNLLWSIKFWLFMTYFCNFLVPFSFFYDIFASLAFVSLLISSFSLRSETSKKQIFFASKRNKFCSIFASFRFNRKRTAHPIHIRCSGKKTLFLILPRGLPQPWQFLCEWWQPVVEIYHPDANKTRIRNSKGSVVYHWSLILKEFKYEKVLANGHKFGLYALHIYLMKLKQRTPKYRETIPIQFCIFRLKFSLHTVLI
jgi:hypothetical protein